MLPTCLFDSTIAAAPAACDNTPACKNDVKGFGLAGFASKKEYTPVGIAKDGHIIYGPYINSTYKIKGTDVDVCNGKMVNGRYAYFATEFHPYFVGCWGPGNYPQTG
jgi:hypothetical protein